MTDLRDKVESELGTEDPSEVLQLNLDNAVSGGSLNGAISTDFTSLQLLSLNNTGLRSVNGFPALPSLRQLELSDNRIFKHLGPLTECISLESINLSGNKIRVVDELEPLSKLPHLRRLYLESNPLLDDDDDSMRKQIFGLLPNLKYLDEQDADGNEEPSDDEGDQQDEADGVYQQDDDDDENDIYNANDDDDDDDGDSEIEEGGSTTDTLSSSGSVSVTRDPSTRRRHRQTDASSEMTSTEMAMWLSTVVRQTQAEEQALDLELEEGCYKQAKSCLRCGLKPSKKKKLQVCRYCNMTVCAQCITHTLEKQDNNRVCDECYAINKDITHRRNKFLNTSPTPLLAGYFTKRGQKRKSWQRRFWVLDGNGYLWYYDNDAMSTCKGVIPLSQVIKVTPAKPDDGIKWPALIPSRAQSPDSESSAETLEAETPDLRVVLELSRLNYAVVFENEAAYNELLFALGRFAGLCVTCNSACFPPLATDCSGSSPQGKSPRTSTSSEPASEGEGVKVYYLPESGAVAHDGCMRCQRGDVLTNRDGSAEEVFLFRHQLYCLAHATEELEGKPVTEHLSARRASLIQAIDLKAVIPSSVVLVMRAEYKRRQEVILEQACMQAIQARKQRQQAGFLDDESDTKSMMSTAADDKQPLPEQIQCAYQAVAFCAKAPQLREASPSKVHRTLHLPSNRSLEMVEYQPAQFAILRKTFGIDDADFARSFGVVPTTDCRLGGGSSGSLVLRTMDQKYIVKMIPKQERDVLLQLLPSFVEHVQTHPQTLLNRFCGLFEIKLKKGRTGKYRPFMVMENIAGRAGKLKVHQKFDLKGSYVNRETKSTKGVQKDLNLNRLFLVSERACSNITMQLFLDALFLDEHHIMDYSLLVCVHNCDGPECCKERRKHEVTGIDDQGNPKLTWDDMLKWGVRSEPDRGEEYGSSVFYFGVIDILQRWNAKKKTEHMFKTQVQRKDTKGISAVDADTYASRFKSFVNSIVLDPVRLERERELEQASLAASLEQAAPVDESSAATSVDTSVEAERPSTEEEVEQAAAAPEAGTP
eukprot:m.201948 g.201948  ORF g.201948 m.201948 type:complete len:1043 (-) comp17058_c1_seq38:71-3199(-)